MGRVLRGGSWNNNPRNLRLSNRNDNDPSNRNDDNGVRCAREAEPGPRRPGAVAPAIMVAGGVPSPRPGRAPGTGFSPCRTVPSHPVDGERPEARSPSPGCGSSPYGREAGDP